MDQTSNDHRGDQTTYAAEALQRHIDTAAIETACNRIAPLWPLKRFVAVNPFFGLSEQDFAAACVTMKRVSGADMTMPRAFYHQHIEDGRITDADIATAIKQLDGRTAHMLEVEAVKLAAAIGSTEIPGAHDGTATVANVVDQTFGSDWSRVAVAEIAKFCGGHFDHVQAAWRSPWQQQPLFVAWKAQAAIDHTPAVLGLTDFAQYVEALPADPTAIIDVVLKQIALPQAAVDDYLYRSLLAIAGWAAYVRYEVWDQALYGKGDDSLVHLLAIRMAWAGALHAQFRENKSFADAWSLACRRMAAGTSVIQQREVTINAVLQDAFDIAYQRQFVRNLHSHNLNGATTASATTRPTAQAVFCIDVRSEVFRRALETVAPAVETGGFAGFFGFPIEYIPVGHQHGTAQCPVLLTPKFRVREAVLGASLEQEKDVMTRRNLYRRASAAWKSFKTSAVTCFSYVEAAGLGFAIKLVSDSLALTRTVNHPNAEGFDAATLARIGPQIALEEHQLATGDGSYQRYTTGFADTERVDMAGAILGAMSMTRNFARLVLLCGHGSTTVNNPHASGLDCGACGGHTGEANARVAASILNDPAVRVGLAMRGLTIPDDTVFLGALHDTTTDAVALYGTDTIPASHQADLRQLRAWLAQAGQQARALRAPTLGIDGSATSSQIDADVIARSRDWSQVRPEWGLAGNAAFIAAPRERTKGMDLAGRVFLHNYQHEDDKGYGVLELIMTAPMVVANWINMQYYGSTVNNEAFGSGNKVLHNVVAGTLGVLQGNGGDLQVGLPMQSVHDGERFVHEPLRLNVFIEAPIAEMNTIITKHKMVRDLLDNRWLNLYAISDSGRTYQRYVGALTWAALDLS